MGTIIRALVAYIVLLLMIRITSRRAAGPATPFQLILIFLFGGMSIQAVVSDDRSLANAILGVMMIAWTHLTLAKAKTRWPALGRIVDGTPVLLVENGHWHEDRLARLSLHDTDVMAAGRLRGLLRREQVRHAVFERNGDIAIIPKDEDGQRDGNGDGEGSA
jgi:uncharacterized membrane protein YcaP (DUF421 family)